MFPSLIKTLFGILISYTIGAFPTAYILARISKKIDIRQYGSGNVGATNVFRTVGKLPGIIVLVMDIFKGLICTTVIADVFGQVTLLNRITLGIAAVVGHNWTVFLRFKGGKGMATSLGVLIGLATKTAIIKPVLLWSVAVWMVTFISTGYISLSSIVAAFFFPLLAVIFLAPLEVIILGVVFCVFVVLRHQSNISRLLRKEEPRVSFPFFRRK